MNSPLQPITSSERVSIGAVIIAVLESRRAYQMAMAVAKRLIAGPGSGMQWDDPEPSVLAALESPSGSARADTISSCGHTVHSAYATPAHRRRAQRFDRRDVAARAVIRLRADLVVS